MLDLYLVRHAQTEPNVRGRYPAAGDDPPLSGQGFEQASALHLPAVQQIYSSPALRCLQTAQQAGAQPQPAPELQEANFGLMAGHTWNELEREYGELPRRWLSALGDPRSHYGPPEGETGQQFHGRVQGWLAGLPQQGTVLAFAHAGSIMAALRLTVDLRAVNIQHAKLTHLRRAGGQWWLEGLNS